MASKPKSDNGDQNTPIAICGIGVRLPRGIQNTDQLWESIASGPGAQDSTRLSSNGQKDPNSVDATFWAPTSEEANGFSPRHIKLLEVTRECLEDACEISYRGEDACVGCYVSVLGEEDVLMISWKYDLKGPSMVIESSLSSSLVALREACCAIRSGDSRSAIVVGSSSEPGFEGGAEMSETMSVVYIKTLADAIRDGNPIRAVIQEFRVKNIEHDQRSESDTLEESPLSFTNLVKAVESLDKTSFGSSTASFSGYAKSLSIDSCDAEGHSTQIIIDPYNQSTPSRSDNKPELVLFSAHNKPSLAKLIESYRLYAQTHPDDAADIAYTRALRREVLEYKAFSVLFNSSFVNTSNYVRSSTQPSALTMIFNGQGAQWAGMGQELIQTDSEFREDIEKMDTVLKGLKVPPTWSIKEELLRDAADPENKVHSSQLSYPLSTALQIALVNRFERLGITPKVVIGHSSGEIAAAYAAGFLSFEDAISIAYYYGHVTTRNQEDGGMGVIGLGVEEVNDFLEQSVVIACENSPSSTTISGSREAVERVLKSVKAAKPEVTARALRINVAYHSHHMAQLADDLLGLLKAQEIASQTPKKSKAIFVSTVNEKVLEEQGDFSAAYWISNLVSRVRFSTTVSGMVRSTSEQPLFLEIGPHSALSLPLSQICAAENIQYRYISAQTRGTDSAVSFLSAVGRLWQESMPMNLAPLFANGRAIFGLPQYFWSHDDADDSSHVTNLSASEKRMRIVAEASFFESELPDDEVPTTELEIVLQAIWADILRDVIQFRRQDIGKNYNFFLLGGDSLTTVELVTVAYQHGIRLSPAAISDNAELAQMAAVAIMEEEKTMVSDTKPFSLINEDKIDNVKDEILKQCKLTTTKGIEDVYPCTTLQEGFMALGTKQPGSYIHRVVYKLMPDVEIGRFIAAWEATFSQCGSLRSRVVLVSGQALQAVIAEDIAWENFPPNLDTRGFLDRSQSFSMSYGERLSRHALVRDSDGGVYFVWLIHHAVFDGLTMRIVLDTLYHTYRGNDTKPLQPYSNFIRYVESLDSAATIEYWKKELDGAQRSHFPPTKLSATSKDKVMKKKIPFRNTKQSSLTTATILRAAWALLLARYCDSDDVCFGTTLSGRQAAVPGLNEIPGPMIATVPIRIKIDRGMTVSTFLKKIQAQAAEMVAHEQYGLQNISKLGQNAEEACDFSNLIVIQPNSHLMSIADTASDAILQQSPTEKALSEEAMRNYFNYPLVLQPRIGEDSIELDLTYYVDAITEGQLEALCLHYEHIIQQLLASNDLPLSALSVSGSWDLEQSLKANNETTEIVDLCLHQLIERQAKSCPNSSAVQAWDLELTYLQLDCAANRLAHYLVRSCGVKDQDLVHVCFEKSAWFFVSIIAVNKAGATWVPLDPSHPFQRQQQVVSQTKATLALASTGNVKMCSELVENVVEVSHLLDEKLTKMEISLYGPINDVSPDNAAYVLFTSGSTGTPKGLVMQHRAVCTSQTAITKRLKMTSEVRMLQFASFVFDLSIGEIVGPWVVGGCLCVPSEETRMNNLVDFINAMKVTWAYLTPSFTRTLTPEDIPGLELLLFAGEPVGRDVFEGWFGKVRLINGWGPAETCVFSTLHEWKSLDESPLTIGRPVGGCCWIVDEQDPQRLAPIGTLGEVVIQGPTILREYLADSSKTEALIVRSLPEWVPDRTAHWNRFYKSGDLCRYNADGTIQFGSRKDNQVKIRGLRVELGEIEHRIRENLESVKQVTVDVAKGDGGANIVTYFCFTDDTNTIHQSSGFNTEDLFVPMTSELQSRLIALVGQLSVTLPRYMIPTLFIPCRYMPFITSTKLDMKLLRRKTSNLNKKDLARYSLIDISADSIGRDDNFLRMGGDSIAAIYFVSAARDVGISIAVKDVFDDPRLFQVASKATLKVHASQASQIKPFALLSDSLSKRMQSDSVRTRYGLGKEQIIEDAYPCTPIQEGLMALTAKQPGSYISRWFYRISKKIDIAKFKAAWTKSVKHNATLRTRIVLEDGCLVQAVITNDGDWEQTAGHDLESYKRLIPQMDIGYGTRLNRFALVEEKNGIYLVWIIHHAIYDGWSMRIALDSIYSTYHEWKTPSISPYSNFISYLNNMNNEAAAGFWRFNLSGAQRPIYPVAGNHVAADKLKSTIRVVDRLISFSNQEDASITMATILRAAWAIVLGRHCDATDVCYGATVSGRQADMDGLLSTPGAIIATIPIRVHLKAEMPVRQMLQDLQAHALDMIPYEQYGLSNISKLSPEAREACDFTSLLVIQPKEQESIIFNTKDGLLQAEADEDHMMIESMNNYFNYPLVMLSCMAEENVNQRFLYNPNILSESEVEAISYQFEHVVQQLLNPVNKLISDISLVGKREIQQAADASRYRPATESCTHWEIYKRIEANPDAPAFDSWDAKMTYREMGVLASRLAAKLQSLGVGPDVLVPISFPKSTPAMITMVAIQMAGGALVPLDPAAPLARLQSIVSDTQAKLIVTHPSLLEKIQELGTDLLIVDFSVLDQLPDPGSKHIPSHTTPDNLYAVLFTSGSTGKPKGIQIPHSSLCSVADAHAAETGVGPGSRVFQFSAYTFDIGILDVLVTLMRGGCVCVPSDHDRLNNLAGAINATQANWVFLTPTVADMINPAEVPCLTTVNLGGEAVNKKAAERWEGYTSLNGLYGPAEASICARNADVNNGTSTNLGFPLSSAFWAVEPNDPSRLVPIGCIGELLIQSPILAYGYLNVDAKVAANWLENMTYDWLPSNGPKRAYRTGDLVRRNPDGTFDFMGRKDNQVKIRGQRVELSEIDYTIQTNLPDVKQIMVDVIDNSEAGLSLIAFLCFSGNTRGSDKDLDDIFMTSTPEMKQKFAIMLNQLHLFLPHYMIPTIFVPCKFMPLNASAKLDHKALRTAAVRLSRDQLVAYTLSDEEDKQPPETPMEAKLQYIWAQTLKISPDSIGRGSNFLRLGGDSIAAIYSVMAANEAGIILTVKDIFDNPTLSTVASKAAATSGNVNQQNATVEPFSLVDTAIHKWTLGDELHSVCKLLPHQVIEDAFPVTSFQEGLMAMTVKHPGSYIAKHVYKIPKLVDLQRFKQSWEETIKLCGILRTRIVLHQESSIQVVINEDIAWDSTSDQDVVSYMKWMRNIEMTYGSSLCRYALIEERSGDRYFVWTIHHTAFDGWTMQIILETLRSVYHQENPSAPRPFSNFINYTSGIDHIKAKEFWSSQLQDAKRASFPAASSSPRLSLTRVMKKRISFPILENSSITKPSILRAAWAIVLGRYSDAKDICFGTTVSGRQAPLAGMTEIAGPAVATVPVRVHVNGLKSVTEFLHDIQSQATDMVAYEQFGLQNIAKVSESARDACNFSSLLVIQPGHFVQYSDDSTDAILNSDKKSIEDEAMQNYFTYPLIVEGVLYENHVELLIIYDSEVLMESQITALTYHLEHVTQQLAVQDSTLISEISVAGPWDLEESLKANSEVPDIINTCLHELIEKKAAERPSSPAIVGWDRTFTYAEFNEAANRLAHHLMQAFTIKSDELIHVCFEKSAWYFVAILAVNKAGAGWVPLDPSHPEQRLRHILSQTHSRIVLHSPANAKICSGLGLSAIEISSFFDQKLTKSGITSATGPVVKVTPRNIVYVLFTSGSTGTPKGLVMEHGSVCTSQTAISKRLKLTTNVRMLQFAAFVFDLSIGEIVAPLISGASLYIPDENTRLNHLSKFIQDNQINWAFLTPAFVRTIQPKDVPTLQLLVLAGEAVGRDVLKKWFDKVRLINGWGPAETCVFSTLHEWHSVDESPLNIGRPVGGFCWVVDPENPHQLAPIGTVGEIIVQGPTLLREYLANSSQTKLSIIYDLPTWAPRRESQYWNRFYKSGDLGYYNPDGTIEFLSRKDTQIKIRGLRVELGEIEHYLKLILNDIRQIAVDVIKGENGSNLVAYFCFNDDSKTSDARITSDDKGPFMSIDEDLQARLIAASGELRVVLPSYMVPTFFIPCSYMPTNISTKLDRKELERYTTALSVDALSKYSLISGMKRAPETPMEIQLQQTWAEILNIPVESIGRDDSFLGLGGDSITAIHFTNLMREEGISLSVKDLFEDPRLLSVASKAKEINGDFEFEEIQPFSLLEKELRDVIVSGGLQKELKLSENQRIEDAYPCSELQQGLMALSVKQPGSYVAKHTYRLPDHVDLQEFKEAWEFTSSEIEPLRTRVVMIDGSCIQVVINEEFLWETAKVDDVHTAITSAQSYRMTYGTPLSRYTILQDRNGSNYFMWAIHHSVHDGWSLRIILETLRRDIDAEAAADYWRDQLENAKRASFPPSAAVAGKATHKTRMMIKSIPFPASANSSITKATVLRAAWAITLARYCNTSDVTFGSTISGRQAAVPGLTEMAGPAVATVPVRVRLDNEQRASKFLQSIQSQASEMIPFEQYGLQNISRLNPDARDACEFSSLMLVQPMQHLNGEDIDLILVPVLEQDIQEGQLQNYFSYPLVLQGHIHEDRVKLVLIYDSMILPESQVMALSHQFHGVVQQLLNVQDYKLGEISVASSWDLDLARTSNGDGPEIVDDCVHLIIERQTERAPHALAIQAWDGSLTYKELDLAVNKLANFLIVHHGVKIGDIIHVCFEKSIWYVVSVLAINKAGAAWVPMDPAHPFQRLQQVTGQTGAKLALTSSIHADLCSKLLGAVIEVSLALYKQLDSDENIHDVKPTVGVAPNDVAYVLFTSGSTGVPKGIIMEHASLCTSQRDIAKRLGLTSSVRMLQFSSFVFDVSVGEIMLSLMHGGCVCIPSDYGRLNNLDGFIRDSNVTCAFLTPSFARTLRPQDVPSLELIVLAGEPVSQDVFDLWFGKTRLVNGWGPAETCVLSAIHEWKSAEESSLTIGHSVGSFAWIVDAQNPQRLAPVGCIGEIVMQGPTLLREYLADPTKTVSSTLTSLPNWAPRLHDRKWDRFYKTGDLGFYNPDGTIHYSGRKDTQVKIRGLRVELGEIEHHIRKSLDSIQQVAVDVLQTETGTNLVSYICFSNETKIPGSSFEESDDMFLSMAESVHSDLNVVISKLNDVLPRYMIPTYFIPCKYMPLILSGKLDRIGLYKATATLSQEELEAYSLSDTNKHAPDTAMEIRLQNLWAEILSIPSQSIGKDDSFFRIGGDSIAAIRLVSLAREYRITLSVNDIFEDPRLSSLASTASAAGQYEENLATVPAFSLLGDRIRDFIQSPNIYKDYGLSETLKIEDAYPTTKLQEGFC
ncbi:hypothetical protein V8C35DRAFT_327127 [Trichoderma chlorosporum]